MEGSRDLLATSPFRPLAFYVYAYAFGRRLGNALYAATRTARPAFRRSISRCSGRAESKHHKELLAPASASNASDPAVWDKGLSMIEGPDRRVGGDGGVKRSAIGHPHPAAGLGSAGRRRARAQSFVRVRQRRAARPCGLFLGVLPDDAAGVFAILPVLGLWMLSARPLRLRRFQIPAIRQWLQNAGPQAIGQAQRPALSIGYSARFAGLACNGPKFGLPPAARTGRAGSRKSIWFPRGDHSLRSAPWRCNSLTLVARVRASRERAGVMFAARSASRFFRSAVCPCAAGSSFCKLGCPFEEDDPRDQLVAWCLSSMAFLRATLSANPAVAPILLQAVVQPSTG